jgi:hypothetical protein
MFTGSRNLPINNFASVWKILLESEHEGVVPGVIVRRLSPDIPHDIFLGVEKPSNRRILLFRVRLNFALEIQNLPSFRGFDISEVRIPEDKGKFRNFGLILKDPVFEDLFTTLTEDIVNFSIAEVNEKQFFEKIRNRLESWQHFLDEFGPLGMSDEAQRGLYGELRFLRDFLIPLAGPKRAINSWKGPFKSYHDFQISGVGIEVKTSIGKQHQKITISSEQQLDASGLQDLFLYHLSLREIQDGGFTLPLIVDEIRHTLKIQNGPMSEFETALFMAGYLDSHRERYQIHGYIDRAVNIFQIKDNFPRIIENDLKNGIGDVQYTIDVSACAPFRESEKKFREKLGGILNE